MHILILAQNFPPDIGGGASRAYNIVKGLILNGCKTTVISAFPYYPYGDVPKEYRGRPFKVEFLEDIKVIRTFVPPIASRGLINRLILFLCYLLSSLFVLPLISDVDIVWAANPNILSLFAGIIYGFFNECPIALNVDDLWPEDLYSLDLLRENSIISTIAEYIAKIAYHKADLITPLSPGYVDVIKRKYRVNHKKILVVRSGVDNT